MNKLLLLATILVSFLIKDYAAATPLGRATSTNDTTETGLLRNGSETWFKDLFEAPSNESHFSLGKLNPKAISFIQDYVETESDDLMALKITGKRYFNIIESALEKRSLPTELKYLAVIESELKSTATSVKGAGGPLATDARNGPWTGLAGKRQN
jgi:membrane-bound lytic murein transglycosylase D